MLSVQEIGDWKLVVLVGRLSILTGFCPVPCCTIGSALVYHVRTVHYVPYILKPKRLDQLCLLNQSHVN